VNARSALFDLYGDHLRARGGRAPVAALVRLLAPLGVAAPAVRTAVSRMVRQGWLEPARLADGRGYALTAKASKRLDEAAARIYRTDHRPWDGRWHLVVTARPSGRAARERLRAGLSYLGYAPLDEATWMAPRPSVELEPLLESEGVRAERFWSRHDGDAASLRALVAGAWDLDALGSAYAGWLAQARDLPAAAGSCTDEEAFAARSALVHEWRKFLFRDPGLPAELLPADWPGEAAAAFFDHEERRLAPAAARFVDDQLRRSASENGE
jgi:phenylacetic acid degradation operon negative regulatory protein